MAHVRARKRNPRIHFSDFFLVFPPLETHHREPGPAVLDTRIVRRCQTLTVYSALDEWYLVGVTTYRVILDGKEAGKEQG